eukprot:952803-Alexandrium_andersonii.AAC.1
MCIRDRGSSAPSVVRVVPQGYRAALHARWLAYATALGGTTLPNVARRRNLQLLVVGSSFRRLGESVWNRRRLHTPARTRKTAS